MLGALMLALGTRIGVYEVVASLGAGGMGEVYRAHDTRLGRDVALKVLPAQLSSDPSSLARFESEARRIAALNHPNVVAIFDTGNDGRIAYIVTELVDGTTLRGMQLTVRKVTDIAAQVADALAAAHRAGVTHRDIKPDNVMVTRDGRVKLLDFGIAKAAAVPDGETVAQTAFGSTLGTPGYMAPEQVRAGVVDQRTDIFALGVLLYEMLAGTPPFKRETPPEILTATLHVDPPDLPAGIPDALQRVVRRCLEKNPGERFQSAEDLAFALRQLTGTSGTTAAAKAPSLSARAGGRRLKPHVWIAAAGFAIGALVTASIFMRWAARQDSRIDALRLIRITSDRRDETSPAISPDGRSLAYFRAAGGGTEVLVRPLDSPDAVTVARSSTPLYTPVWSTDSGQVCYRDVHRDLWCVGAAGGSPRRVLQDVTWAHMAPNGRDFYFIRVFQGRPWLYRSSTTGGEAQRVGTDGWPTDLTGLSAVSPDGSSLVVTTRSRDWLVSLPAGERRAVPLDESTRIRSIAWLPDSRHIVTVEETTALIGSRIVLQDLRSAARHLVFTTADDIQSVAATPDGAGLVYAGGPVERDIVEYSPDGRFVRPVAASSMLEGFPSWAPRGDRFVYRAGGPGQIDTIWIGTPDGSPPALVQRLASNVVSQLPFSPDGGRIAYADDTGIYVVAATGGRAVRLLATANAGAALCWSPDGDWIWYSERPTGLGRVPSGGGNAQPVDASPGVLATCSPDGRWLLRRSQTDFELTSADGKTDRPIGRLDQYAIRSNNRGELTSQFSGDGRRVYLLRLDRRTVDVFDVASGRKVSEIAFQIPVEDQIETFSFSPDGTRVLLTTGGDRDDLWMATGFAHPTTSWRRWFTHWDAPAQ